MKTRSVPVSFSPAPISRRWNFARSLFDWIHPDVRKALLHPRRQNNRQRAVAMPPCAQHANPTLAACPIHRQEPYPHAINNSSRGCSGQITANIFKTAWNRLDTIPIATPVQFNRTLCRVRPAASRYRWPAGALCIKSSSLARPMPFDFSGIFGTSGDEVLVAFRAQFGGVGKRIHSPFGGFGVSRVGMAISRLADDPEVGPDLESEAFAEELIAFSARFPDTTFVYLYAECFGGTCEYAGFAFREGRRIHDEPFRDVAGDDGPLKRLVAYLSADLGKSGYFEPLRRDFFTRTEPPQVPQSARVSALSERLAHAMEDVPAAKPKSTIWSRLFGGGPGRANQPMLWTAPRRVHTSRLWYNVPRRVALAATDCHPLCSRTRTRPAIGRRWRPTMVLANTECSIAPGLAARCDDLPRFECCSLTVRDSLSG